MFITDHFDREDLPILGGTTPWSVFLDSIKRESELSTGIEYTLFLEETSSVIS